MGLALPRLQGQGERLVDIPIDEDRAIVDLDRGLHLVDETSLINGLARLRDELSALGGTERIVREVEKLLDVRPEND